MKKNEIGELNVSNRRLRRAPQGSTAMKTLSRFWQRAAIFTGYCLLPLVSSATAPADSQLVSISPQMRHHIPVKRPPPTAKKEEPPLSPLEQKSLAAVALLYYKDGAGGYNQLCTDLAFENRGMNVYRFISAAHCVAEDDVELKIVQVAPLDFYIYFDDGVKKVFYPAKIYAVGYQNDGDDFAIFDAVIDDRAVSVIPIAKRDGVRGERVINHAGPLGLGIQTYRGHVTNGRLDRPIINNKSSINWTDSTVLDIPSGPGSSGSSIISISQKGIIAILVGGFTNHPFPTVARPASKLKKFYEAVQNGTYPHFNAEDPESHLTASPAQVQRIIEHARYGFTFQLEPASNIPPPPAQNKK